MTIWQKITFTLAAIVLLFVLLPASPIQGLVADVRAAVPIGFLNWIFPIGFCCTALGLWCTAITAYYAISWVLRQLQIIG